MNGRDEGREQWTEAVANDGDRLGPNVCCTGRGDAGLMNVDVRNGIPAGQLSGAGWRKSSHSGKQGNCVELARLPGGSTAFRNSRDPDGPALIHPASDLAGFLIAVKDGEFDGSRA